MNTTKEALLKEIEASILAKDGTFSRWKNYAKMMISVYHLQGHMTAEDVIQDLMVKFIEGKRKWDKDRYPCFRTHVFLIIRSHVDNEYKKLQRRGIQGIDSDEEIIDQDTIYELAEQWSDEEFQKFFRTCMEKLSDDEDAGIVFLYLADGKQNVEVAKELGLQVEYIENVKKRIKRKLGNHFAEHFEVLVAKGTRNTVEELS